MSYFLYKQASQTTTDIQYVSYRIFCKKHIENQKKKQIREANHPLFININSLSNLTLYNYEHSNDSILSISMLNLKNVSIRRTTGFEPFYTVIATVTINLIVAVAIVLLNLYVAAEISYLIL